MLEAESEIPVLKERQQDLGDFKYQRINQSGKAAEMGKYLRRNAKIARSGKRYEIK